MRRKRTIIIRSQTTDMRFQNKQINPYKNRTIEMMHLQSDKFNSLKFKNKKLLQVRWLVLHLLCELKRLDLHYSSPLSLRLKQEQPLDLL
jgi:hypothetical protein